MGGIPEGECGIKIKEYMSHFISCSELIKNGEITCRIPKEFDHCLIMLVHVAKHITECEGVGLRHLCDWAVFADKVNIYKYKAQFEGIGLWNFCCLLTDVSVEYLGLRNMQWNRMVSNKYCDCLWYY